MATLGGTRPTWSTQKKDAAPRGIRRLSSGMWAIRFTCGAGCLHKETVGPSKTEAIGVYHQRRSRARGERGWCPRVERQQSKAEAKSLKARRVSFRQYAKEHLAWAKLHHRGWKTEASRIDVMMKAFGDVILDTLTTSEVERFLDSLLEKRSQSTRNRYRTLLHAMLNRAKRHGRVSANPVGGIAKFKEPEGRVKFLLPDEETAIEEALRPDLRPIFTVSVNTGLRWSEQMGLCWADVDFLTGHITVQRSKSGHSREIPMNSKVRSALMDLAADRQRMDDADAPVFQCRHAQADKFFPKAVERAKTALVAAGLDATRLDGYTWHCNRHTFASRLVMAGVDLRAVQVLGGWRTLTMVQRYSHLSRAHLTEAVERLVTAGSHGTSR